MVNIDTSRGALPTLGLMGFELLGDIPKANFASWSAPKLAHKWQNIKCLTRLTGGG